MAYGDYLADESFPITAAAYYAIASTSDRIFALASSQIDVYTLDGVEQVSERIPLHDDNTTGRGLDVYDGFAYVADIIDRRLYAYDISTVARDTTREFTWASFAGSVNAVVFSDDRVILLDSGDDMLYFFEHDGTRVDSEDVSVSFAGQGRGLARNSSSMFVGNFSDNIAYALTLTGSQDSDNDVTLEAEGFFVIQGLTASDTRLYSIDSSFDRINAYDVSTGEDPLTATTLVEISGDGQSAVVSTELANPFVVEVRDQNGDGLSGVTVAFSVVNGGGSLSVASVTTGADGRASTTLTLGSTAGTNTVTATATGITTPVTFTATGTAAGLVATTLERISGNAQTADVGTVLPDPIVVQVNDQNGDPLPGVTVTFAITALDGSLSPTSVATNASGQAETVWTLGATAGINRLSATAAGVTQTRNFRATGTAVTLVATSLVEVSGGDQSALVSTELSDPFVVQVNDQNGGAFSGAVVTFAVTGGGGTLSETSVTTGADGRAESTLALGSTAGSNTVTADVSGISTTITFNATATETVEDLVATSIVRVSGNNQTGTVSTALSDPFVVEVRDQNGDGLSGVSVAFAVTAGSGTLSSASVTTGSNGRAQSTLTLGSTVGTNTVTATVSGISTTITFNATATAIVLVATTLVKVSGDNQTGGVSTALPNPFVVQVNDQNGDALSGVSVTFAVISGGGTLSDTSVTTGADGRASATLTLGSTAGTNTARASVSGISTTRTFRGTAEALVPLLSVSITVPATADLGETVDISATATGEDTIEWKTTGGSIDDPSAADTEITVPSESGVIAVTCVATDADGATASDTAYLTVGDPKANIYTPAVRIEIEGVDVTSRRIPRDGLVVGKSLDYPELLTFRSSGISFNLDNKDGAFDYSNPNNFFIAQGLPAHGRGAKVLVSIGLSQSELMPVFAGEISEVMTRLGDTKARIKSRDLSVRSRQKVIENFGIEITRRITDFEGAALDYDALDPVFYFPIWGLPISRNSVSLIIHHSNGNDIDINIADAIAREGVLSNRNAEIDYTRGLIRFEAPPDDAEATQISATWKRDYRYKRPDFLVRQVLKNTGTQDTVGITNDTDARFAIEQALLRHLTDKIFSSHGRPYFQREGIARWLKHNPDTDKWLMSIDTRLVEYDEYQDDYTELATIPEDTNIEDVPPGDYGTLLEDQSIDVSQGGTPFAFYGNLIYRPSTTQGAIAVDRNTGQVVDNGINFDGAIRPGCLDIYNGEIYLLQQSGGTCQVYNLQSGNLSRTFTISDIYPAGNYWMSITPNYIYVSSGTAANKRTLEAHDHQGNRVSSEDITLGSITIAREVGDGADIVSSRYSLLGFVVSNRIYTFLNSVHSTSTTSFGPRQRIAVFDLNGNEINRLQIPVSIGSSTRGLKVEGAFFYTYLSLRYYAYSGIQNLNYQGFVGYQLDTHDFDSVYLMTTNTVHGDLLTDTIFNQNRLYKYVISTETWTNLLNPTKGQPQLGMPYDFVNQNRILADNRKNFKVIRHNGKTLIFYRRVQSGSAQIAMYNETDDAITNIFSQNYDGNDPEGIPYSMDFWVEETGGNLYVYSFVVTVEFSGNDFTSSVLKLYKRQVQSLGTQSTVFTQAFNSTSGDDVYPVSVSDLILADNRSKFYFILDYQSEADEVGKSELCELPKTGGTRTVRKTYINPLLGPRSPAKVGNRYFYLEGGWVRLPKSDATDDTIPNDERHYPNEGGHLIEIESNGDITDHGIVWRSRSKLDSPDPDPENPQYDGWGLHNAVVSNMVADSRDNLRFVAGYGLPYRINNNLPTAEITGAVPDETNFNWIQYGQDLSTKIASFPTTARRGWELIQQLAQLMNWEIGFGPAMGKVDAVQAADAAITGWSANASFFFRPRTILPAKLRNAISASGNPTTIALNDSGLPADVSEFPVPPSGERYAVIVDKEMFTYTGVTPDANGRTLTGVRRAQNGSTAVAHSIDAGVYFVDYFASGEQGTTLVSITNRSQDFVNLKNDVNVGFGDRVYPAKDQTSIDENGEKTFNLGTSQPLLSRQDQAWAELIGDTYLDELSDLKELLQFTLVFSPTLQPGQLIVVYQLDRVRIEFKLFRLLRVQHHTHPRWQTGVTALEIID